MSKVSLTSKEFAELATETFAHIERPKRAGRPRAAASMLGNMLGVDRVTTHRWLTGNHAPPSWASEELLHRYLATVAIPKGLGVQETILPERVSILTDGEKPIATSVRTDEGDLTQPRLLPNALDNLTYETV